MRSRYPLRRAQKESADVEQMLFSRCGHGASLSPADVEGRSVKDEFDPKIRQMGLDFMLSYASRAGHLAVVRYALFLGANPNYGTGFTWPPLSGAVTYYDWPSEDNERNEVVRCLIAAGADVNGKNGHGESPLAVAVGRRYIFAVRELLRAGADPLQKDLYGQTPFDLAMGSTSEELKNSFLSACTQEEILDWWCGQEFTEGPMQ